MKAAHLMQSFLARSVASNVAVCLLLWLGLTAWLYTESAREESAAFDAELNSIAVMIANSFPRSFVNEPDPTTFTFDFGDASNTALEAKAMAINYQVWTTDRRLISRSSTSPLAPLDPTFTIGFNNSLIDGQLWRVYTAQDRDKLIYIQAGHSREQRRALVIVAMRDGFFTLFFLLIFLCAGLISVAIWTTKPLKLLGKTVGARAPQDMSAISELGLPSEVTPVIRAFNNLLDRAKRAQDLQQQFIADAAHELRTPLSALRLQAQVVQRAQDAVEREDALMQLVSGIDRATRMSAQLLELARVERIGRADGLANATLANTTSTPLADALVPALDACAALATRRDVTVSVSGSDTEHLVSAEPSLLAAALRNLIDNAVRYSPSGSVVAVVVEAGSTSVCVSIVDQGPGIPAAQVERAFEPFCRLGTNDEVGSGLGLSIVKRICDLIGARLILDTGVPGLTAKLILRNASRVGD